jgi:hypothetical protein
MSCKGLLTLSNKVGWTCILQRKILVNRQDVSNTEREVGILFALRCCEQPPMCITDCLSSVFLIPIELAPSVPHFCQSTSSFVLRTRYEINPDFQGILKLVGEMNVELAEIDRLLSDDRLCKLIEAALSKRYPQTTQTGRSATLVKVILRMLALKPIRSLSYEKTINNINASLILRRFFPEVDVLFSL